MATDTVSFNYTIQNGKFAGTRKTLMIQMSAPGIDQLQIGLQGTIAGTSLLGNFISLYLYIRSVRGSSEAFDEIAQRLTTLEPALPNPGQALLVDEVEMEAVGVNVAPLATVVPEAEASIIAGGALDAAAASSIVPGVGWVMGAGILAIGTIIAGGLMIYDIVNSGETPLVSVIFINGIPNSNFQFTSADWTPGMDLIAGDTKETMLQNKAITTMTEAGSLQYTWQTAGNEPSGTSTIEFNFNSGASCEADLIWSINPNTGSHECKLTLKSGDDLLTALCYKQPVQHGGKTHYVLLYLILPSSTGASRASFTIDPNAPMVYDNMWPTETGSLIVGTTSETYYQRIAPFTVGNKSYTLRDIAMSIWWEEGKKEAVINICSDDGGKPGASLETFILKNFSQQSYPYIPVMIKSVVKPLLNASTKYWLTADMTDKASVSFWSKTEYRRDPWGGNGKNTTLRFAVGGDPVI